jgi:hypothetical protein
VRLPILTFFVTRAILSRHTGSRCDALRQANPDTTRAIFEQGEYAKGANPTHTRYKSARPTISEHPDHTCTAVFPLYNWATDTPAGTLTVQLEIVYLPCAPDPNNLTARYITVAPDTPGACPFIYLKGYPDA